MQSSLNPARAGAVARVAAPRNRGFRAAVVQRPRRVCEPARPRHSIRRAASTSRIAPSLLIRPAKATCAAFSRQPSPAQLLALRRRDPTIYLRSANGCCRTSSRTRLPASCRTLKRVRQFALRIRPRKEVQLPAVPQERSGHHRSNRSAPENYVKKNLLCHFLLRVRK